jgi:hypothetical protein
MSWCISLNDARDLMSRYPARIENANKAVVFEMTSPADADHSGTITFTRWRQMALPDTVTRGGGQPGGGGHASDDDHPALELRKDFFSYEVPPEGRTDWHVNFAHHDLFAFYGGALFAQDEMQVAEHPALASLRHALLDIGARPLSVEGGVPTPALVTGVERRCTIATDPNPDEGRPRGLYGNAFASGTEDAVRKATKLIDPPTASNIIAIEAPAHGTGRYKAREIDFILTTAVTAFSAAVRESSVGGATPKRVAIHTGYWGCGAYGGNRTLMPLLQMIAAAIAGVDVLVFHAGTDTSGYDKAQERFEELLPSGKPVSCQKIITRIEGLNFEWGVGDGN